MAPADYDPHFVGTSAEVGGAGTPSDDTLDGVSWLFIAIGILLGAGVLIFGILLITLGRSFRKPKDNNRAQKILSRRIDYRGYWASLSPKRNSGWPWITSSQPDKSQQATRNSSHPNAGPSPLSHAIAQDAIFDARTDSSGSERKLSTPAPLPLRAINVVTPTQPGTASSMSSSCQGSNKQSSRTSKIDLGDVKNLHAVMTDIELAPVRIFNGKKRPARDLQISNPFNSAHVTAQSGQTNHMALITLEEAQALDQARREGRLATRKQLTLEPIKRSPPAMKSPSYANVPIITPGLGCPRVEDWPLDGDYTYDEENISPKSQVDTLASPHPGKRVRYR